jgi:2'-5' RNA ligase
MKSLFAISGFLVLMGCQTPLASGESTSRMGSGTSGSSSPKAFTIEAAAFDGSRERFKSHPNYLSMKTPYAPVLGLFRQLETELGQKLITRGEAHVTVITPGEFADISSYISLDEVERIATKMGIQDSVLEPLCLGRGQARIDGFDHQTYFIVVRSAHLLRIRQVVYNEVWERGGQTGRFEPAQYFPHITVGFLKMDLHIQHGVLKNASSCWREILAQ